MKIYFLFMVGFLTIGEAEMAALEPTKKFDWDSYVVLPNSEEHWFEGRQVIGFYPFDIDYRNSPASRDFVARYFQEAKAMNTDAAVLKYGSDQATLDGLYLEMGVCTGRTINFIAALNPEKLVYGFDSFEGLPEEWNRGDHYVAQGTFALKHKDALPPVLYNVRLIKGMFRDTLPLFKEQFLKDKPIAFLHIDCDIYSAAKEVFDALEDRIVPGTILVFDEFYNYPSAEEHEFKAFQEFLQKTGRNARYLAFNQYNQQTVVRIEE